MGTNPDQPDSTKRERGNLNQKITDRIVADLERGRVPGGNPGADQRADLQDQHTSAARHAHGARQQVPQT
jgi:antirestriction protein ArdC